MRRSPAVALTAAALLATLAPVPGAAADPPATSAAAPANGAASPPAPLDPAAPGTALAEEPWIVLEPLSAASLAEIEATPDPATASTGAAAATADAAAAGAAAAAAAATGAAPAAAAATAPATAAATSPAPAPARAAAAGPARPWRTLPLLGVSLGAGFPDLAHLNLLVRPIDWVRVYAGPCWSYLSWGVQGGVVLAPINWYVHPTLSLGVGKLFATNASRFVGDDPDNQGLKPLLRRVDYHYYAGDLGLEVGSPRGFNFFLRLGLSFVVVTAKGTGSQTEDDGSVVSIRDPRVSAWLPSAKLGFQYWF